MNKSLNFLIGRKNIYTYLALLIGGAISVFGFAPFFLWPLYAIGIVTLIFALDAAPNLRAAFVRGWFFAFILFAFSMFWIGAAFMVDAQKFLWLLPFAVTLLPACLGVFWGLGAVIYKKLSPNSAIRVFLFAAIFGAIEYLRGTIFTGFPWNLPAYVFNAGGLISQNGALIGPYGVSLLALFVFASFATFRDKGSKLVIATAIAIIGGGISYGYYHINYAKKIEWAKPITIATGQGGYSQKDLYDSFKTGEIVDTYLKLLQSPEAKNADVIIWPEGTFPFLVLEEPELIQEFAKYLGNKTLIMGAPRRELINDKEEYFNSIAFISPNSPESIKLYNKSHLVPFGEYLPLKSMFNALGISSLVSYGTDFQKGSGPELIKIDGIPLIEPRICYEIIFPNFVTGESKKADWIVNVSVDAWYGDILGPDQHYNQARWRAIELGKPLVRSASGGWSAIVDSFGNPVVQFKKGAHLISNKLPFKVESTQYSSFGELFFVIFSLVFFLTGILFDKKNVM